MTDQSPSDASSDQAAVRTFQFSLSTLMWIVTTAAIVCIGARIIGEETLRRLLMGASLALLLFFMLFAAAWLILAGVALITVCVTAFINREFALDQAIKQRLIQSTVSVLQLGVVTLLSLVTTCAFSYVALQLSRL
jgi:hypothetical protein